MVAIGSFYCGGSNNAADYYKAALVESFLITPLIVLPHYYKAALVEGFSCRFAALLQGRIGGMLIRRFLLILALSLVLSLGL